MDTSARDSTFAPCGNEAVEAGDVSADPADCVAVAQSANRERARHSLDVAGNDYLGPKDARGLQLRGGESEDVRVCGLP